MEQAGRLLLVRERFAWMGRHSGYDPLCDRIESDWPDRVDSVFRTRSALQNLFYSPLALLSSPKTPFYNGDSIEAELRAMRVARREGSRLIHLTFIENHLRLLARKWARGSARCVGTAHQPPRWWETRHGHPGLARALDALIVTSSELHAYFDDIVPGRVHRIPLAVDTDFFCPALESVGRAKDPPRCLFSGVWLRDHESLEKVIERLLTLNSEIRFDMLVPLDRRNLPELRRLARHERVEWHANLPDDAHRELYRRASLLLLPLLDSAANTALLESISCGLPVITTDVGGARDYTEPSFADLVPQGDVDGLVEAVLRLLEKPEERRARGRAARDFALRELRWQTAAERTMAIYREVLGS